MSKFRSLIQVYKGSEKRDNPKKPGELIMGIDLQNKLRMKFLNKEIAALMQQFGYGEIVEAINIYFPYSTAKENLVEYENFAAFNKNRMKSSECNGERIIKKLEYIKDSKGNTRPVQVPCDEPCRRQPGENQCPLKCTKSAKLIFHIAELYHAGYFDVVAEMSLRAISDLSTDGCIKHKMAGYEQEFGRLDGIEGNQPEEMVLHLAYDRHIPFVLHRTEVIQPKPITDKDTRKTTGSYNMDATTWALDLRPDLQWTRHREYLQMLASAKAAGMQLPQEAFVSTLARLNPQFAALAPAVQPGSSPKDFATPEQKAIAQRAYGVAKQVGWGDEALQEFMQRECNIYSLFTIPNNPVIINNLINKLSDERLMQAWNKKIAPPKTVDVEVQNF